MLTAICKDLVLLPSGAHARFQPWVQCVKVRHAECWGHPWTSWGYLQARCPYWLTGRFPNRVWNAISSTTPLRCPLRGLAIVLQPPPATPPPPRCTAHPSVLDWTRKKYVFGSILHSSGSQMLIHTFSHVFVGEIMGLEGLFWHWAVPPWGRDDIGKMKLFLLPSLLCPIMDFLPRWHAGISLLDYGTSTKVLLSMGDCQNQCSLVVR